MKTGAKNISVRHTGCKYIKNGVCVQAKGLGKECGAYIFLIDTEQDLLSGMGSPFYF